MNVGKLVLALAVLAGATAPAPYQYRFTAGKALSYRTILRSEGSMQLPDGSARPMKLEAQSTVVFTPQEKTPEGWKVRTETTRARTTLDGRNAPPQQPGDTKSTVVVRADGAIAGGEEQTFAIVFPERPLARGDSFASERKSGAAGLPVKTTYTLVDTAAQVRGYPAPVSLFEAKSELAGKAPGRKLRSGGGKIWFDPAAGLLVKSQLSYEFTEEMALEGLGQNTTRTITIHYDSELAR